MIEPDNQELSAGHQRQQPDDGSVRDKGFLKPGA